MRSEEEDEKTPVASAVPPMTMQTTLDGCFINTTTTPSSGVLRKRSTSRYNDDFGSLKAGYIVKASSLKEGGTTDKAEKTRRKRKKVAPGPSIRQFLVTKSTPGKTTAGPDRGEEREEQSGPTTDKTVELGGRGGGEKTGPDKDDSNNKVSPVLTTNNICVSSMRAGMPEDDFVVKPGTVLFEGGGQHTLGGDDEQCEDVVVVGHIPDDDMEKGERLRDDYVQWSCVCAAKFGEECSVPHGNTEMAKFGELCRVPRGLAASGDSAVERLSDSEVMTNMQTVRPGVNEGESNISFLFFYVGSETNLG